MNPVDLEEVCVYVNENITIFHQNRISILSRLTLNQLLKKNPYLFRAKNITKASNLIENTMEAFLSSSEEKCFGDFLEDLAVFVASKTTGGHKSASPGIDLEFSNNDTYHVVSIKSGPNWGNSSQHKKLAQDFRDAVKRLRQSKSILQILPVLGICYGKTRTGYTNDGYLKVVGQNFWTFISGNQQLYAELIEPVGYRAKEHNDAYQMERDRVTNLLTRNFIDQFCDPSGMINWDKLIKENSGNFDLDQFGHTSKI